MATTSNNKADAVLTQIVEKYRKSKGFRSARVQCNRNFGTYDVVVTVDTGTQHSIPTSINHVDIQILEVPPVPIR